MGFICENSCLKSCPGEVLSLFLPGIPSLLLTSCLIFNLISPSKVSRPCEYCIFPSQTHGSCHLMRRNSQRRFTSPPRVWAEMDLVSSCLLALLSKLLFPNCYSDYSPLCVLRSDWGLTFPCSLQAQAIFSVHKCGIRIWTLEN